MDTSPSAEPTSLRKLLAVRRPSVSDAAMQGIRVVSLKYLIPVTCGILTSYTIEQALERAGDDEHNKGSEAALAAIEMVQLQKMLR